MGAPGGAANGSNGTAHDEPHRAEGLVLLEPRHGPPPEACNAAGAVDVTVTAHVMSLSEIDSREQRFEVLLWLQVCARAGRGAGGAIARAPARGAANKRAPHK